MNTASKRPREASSRPAIARRARPGLVTDALAAAVLIASLSSSLAAQDPGTFRLWAAQTGPNQVSLAWDTVPGTKEYRIYVGDPAVQGTLTGRPSSALSAGATGAVLSGVQRMAKGITLVAVDASGRVLRQESFNPVVPATSFPPPAPPTGLNADAPSASEVTVTWDPVPGATAYFVGRAVFQSGFRPLCALCSTETRYVDRNVMAGQPHTYTIAAILPSGVSTRVSSNAVTPGETATTTGTSAGEPGGAVTPATGTAATETSGTTTSTPTTSTPGSEVPAAPVAPPTSFWATVSGPGAVRLTWQPSPSPGVTGYRVFREGSGDAGSFSITAPPTATWYDDTRFGVTAYPHDSWQVNYRIAAITSSGWSTFLNAPQVTVPPPPPPCQLQYQRADNMWAPFGTPEGGLGIESIPQATGQRKSFITDWKYEKQRNDGTTYYGSHLRRATNAAPGRLRVRIRYVEGLGTKEEWVEFRGYELKRFQADLVEVYCVG